MTQEVSCQKWNITKLRNHDVDNNISVDKSIIPKAIARKLQRGKRAVRNRKAVSQQKLPLPSIILANAHSLNNKTDELDGLIKFHYAYKNASAIALTET